MTGRRVTEKSGGMTGRGVTEKSDGMKEALQRRLVE